jgi:hypothetical protein
VKDDSSDHIMRVFPVASFPGFMVVTPSFSHLSISFRNQRFSNYSFTATMDIGFVKLTSDSFVETRFSNEYSVLLFSYVCCGISVIFRNNPSQCTTFYSVNVDFRRLFLFADVFPWFVYADITLESVAFDAPNTAAVFVTDAPAKRAPTTCPLSKSDKSPIFRFFHTVCHWTQSLMYCHEHYRV